MTLNCLHRLKRVRIWGVGLALAGVMIAPVHAVTLKPDAPTHLIVPDGASQYSLAARYLDDPGAWRALWARNPEFSDPPRLYPGDQLRLEQKDGVPTLTLVRGQRVITLSPSMRRIPQRDVVTVVPRRQIDAFLGTFRLMDEAQRRRLPSVLADEGEHLISGAGSRVYARGHWAVGEEVSLYQPGGYPGLLAGRGEQLIERTGRARVERMHQGLAVLKILEASRPVDRTTLVAQEARLPALDAAAELRLQPAPEGFRSRLSLLPQASTLAGSRDIVLVDGGSQEGLAPGQVLSLYSRPEAVTLPGSDTPVVLPGELAGRLVVFQVFPAVALGLVVSSNRPISDGAPVASPTGGSLP
ncbi:hypothetical protein [Larsenimonas rhizosphaerae]|uniref:LysM domain-containing protein n=1 Tax=Larsenimonas rhizosphaerae TaxID=2944682 RepID=A0AA41ZFY5_9GAMM|nr:hypothetical protein [Larsenimonas rhizosphaerae]MCX2524544.1 hypothetical protein [Larsenimonas rhizosphaerae]